MDENYPEAEQTKSGQDYGAPEQVRIEQNIDRDIVRLTRGLVVWTAALFFGALVAAGIAFFQLRAMQGQLLEMQSSSSDTHSLSVATQQLATEAAKQVEGIDKLRKASEAQSRAAEIQAHAMEELRKSGELQASESKNLAEATRRQAFSTHDLVDLTKRVADATSDQSVASQTVAKLEVERSRPRFEISTTIGPKLANDIREFFPQAFRVTPVSGVARIDAAIAHEVLMVHDGFALCTVVLDNFFVWNMSSSDFRISDGADILRKTATSAERDGLALQHLWVNVTVDYETIEGKSERQFLRFALGRAEPTNEIPEAMQDPWPHLVVGTSTHARRALLGFETSKPLNEGCTKAADHLNRYPTIAMTTAWAIEGKEPIPIGEAKDFDPSIVVLKDPKIKPEHSNDKSTGF